jgi:UDP-2-acetamido-2-deoxy-ribo-hexuluronate aminotransferase
MDTLQCAVVLAKLDRFEWEVERRLHLGDRYNQLLDSVGIKRVQQRSDRTSVFAQYSVLVDDRDVLQKKLNEVGVPTAVHYPVPLNEQPAYKDLCRSSALTPVSQTTSRRVMSLPMSPDLSLDNLEKIVEELAGLAR